MSYLRLIQYKMQDWAENIASALNIEIAIADKNLTRIVGTGNFYDKIEENCPKDSLFATVIQSRSPKINLVKGEDCLKCSNFSSCSEFANISYPIVVEEEVIGVISFAAFNEEQTTAMKIKKDEYINILKHTIEMIEREILSIQMTNMLKEDTTEVNEIINCLSKGIILLNCQDEITHINNKAIKMLNMNLSNQQVIGKNIKDFITGIKLQDTGNKDMVDCWKINNKEVKVLYSMNKISLKRGKSSLMISFDLIRDIINLAKTYEEKEKVCFSNMIGKSKPILEAINRARIAANTDSTILIEGESGTGKDLFARSIHNESLRKDGPFIPLNCASIPESLMESELFGYEKGAFTGANVSGKKGKIELAHNGTLFLDEIGDLPLHLQAKLLRVLQDRTIDRVGGARSIDVNIRVISATNKNLIQLVRQGMFRLDLFYRLNVIPIVLPPLRDREEDVLLCAEFIIEKLCKRSNQERKKLSEHVKEFFLKYSWPGNIRELENVLEHAICFCEGKYITLKHLPVYFLENIQNQKVGISEEFYDFHSFPIGENKTLEQLKTEFEKFVIQEMIQIHGNTLDGKKAVAKRLNIGLTTLYRKLNQT
ncbi:sigma-54 interaction domain-containing protein [Garciella nitratireducens]|uniref:Transcriptional regulator containing PAS, AAA-type ATPase, and DNA-binding Fis domains n=1 Tax=Garciella nitratireducens DSM 15102 TaxID=1121911 RepID=A0A1T4PAU1_9FIRM|nr:sigma 54-interacting transcriptional regulator [Garciella nitratireducens]SJZ88622.1 Transcriptional regulator containing PAS, AAA-type ATPase, and DNA-binding Fis domains [Garciella nitratireducens DSM 15102]